MLGLDPELRQLIVSEYRRHADRLEAAPLDSLDLKRTLHALKGSSAIAGERALSSAFTRLERRLAAKDPSVRSETIVLLRDSALNIENCQPGMEDTWPIPPSDLKPSRINLTIAPRYRAEMQARIANLGTPAGLEDSPLSALEDALRTVHTMKGASGTVGDEIIAWFCHGLEDELKRGRSAKDDAIHVLDDLDRWRMILSQLLEDPAHGLQALRARPARETPSTRPPNCRSDPPSRDQSDVLLHAPARSVDRVMDKLRSLATMSSEMERHSEGNRTTARELSILRANLVEARRLIGPPRPWGAPAAALSQIEKTTHELSALAARLSQTASIARHKSRRAQRDISSSQTELGAIRKATMANVFDSVRDAIESMVRHSDRQVSVTIRGEQTPIDRRVADALTDPLVQLARNAVAHGIESSEIRLASGKPETGSILLSAETRGAHLIVSVEDDGAGVNASAVRTRAIECGIISENEAKFANDDTLVHLLFMPGMTTRASADLLAGRGIGLDLVLHAVRRLGATIRLRNRPGHGLSAEVDVPIEERGVVSVLWVRSGSHRYAVSARRILNVVPSNELEEKVPSLAALLQAKGANAAESGFVLTAQTAGNFFKFAVQAVEGLEEASVRPVPSLIATAGPYVGVVLSHDGKATLLIDLPEVAKQAVLP